MCKSNNADEICQVHIDDYISKYRNGIRPAVFYCFHIRGTVLLALQNRSLESKSTAERPPFAEELVNNPKNFWPLLSSCNLNYSGKDTRGGKYSKIILAAFRDMVKYTQRKAAKHGALINMPAGWTSGRSFSNEREAREWLLQVTNLDASSTLTVKKKKSSAYQQVQRSHGTPDALASALQGLNLDERLGSEDIQEVMTAVMQKSSDNKQSKTGQAKQRMRIARPTRLNRGEQVRAAGSTQENRCTAKADQLQMAVTSSEHHPTQCYMRKRVQRNKASPITRYTHLPLRACASDTFTSNDRFIMLH